MNCERIEDQLSAYVDGELDPEVHESVGSHLAACSECQGTLRWLMDYQRLTAGVPEEALSEQCHQRLMSQVATAQSASRPPFGRAYVIFPTAVAGLAMAAAASFEIGRAHV